MKEGAGVLVGVTLALILWLPARRPSSAGLRDLVRQEIWRDF